MQFKLLSIFAAALTVQAMSSTQQGQAMQQSEQSQQVHQLEQLTHDIVAQHVAEFRELDIGGAGLNATAVTSILNSVSGEIANTGNIVSNISSTTIAQQFPVSYVWRSWVVVKHTDDMSLPGPRQRPERPGW